MKFTELNINSSILQAIEKMGYTQASPIQEQAIPVALKGQDILGCAQTGTGKTAAFGIPTIQLLDQHVAHSIRALILTPTRELAIQIQENMQQYCAHTSIRSTVIFGGVPQGSQVKALQQGVDILIATPGRLNDLCKQGYISLKNIEIFILDEADRMLDMGFFFDVKKVIAKLPKQKQTLLFSATMPTDIKKLASELLVKPVFIEVTPVSSTADKIDQSLYYVDKPNKKRLLIQLIKQEQVFNALVFTRTKVNANRLAKYLNNAGIQADAIHGDKSQNARQRALQNFKDCKIQVLVATDIAARGIDINELEYVFNYEIPNEPESYVHRIGRTARAGLSGKSISFVDCNEIAYIKDIEKLISKKIPVVEEHDFPMENFIPTPKGKAKNRSRNTSQNRKTNKSNSKKPNTNRPSNQKSGRRNTKKPNTSKSSFK